MIGIVLLTETKQLMETGPIFFITNWHGLVIHVFNFNWQNNKNSAYGIVHKFCPFWKPVKLTQKKRKKER
jgi:hypothetical protein